MKALVQERGQVTIPKALRNSLGIKPHTVLDFHEENGTLVAVKLSETDPVDEVLGCLTLSNSSDRILKELRGDA